MQNGVSVVLGSCCHPGGCDQVLALHGERQRGASSAETAAKRVLRGAETTPRSAPRAADWCVKCTGRKNWCQKRKESPQFFFLSRCFQKETSCSRKAEMFCFSIFGTKFPDLLFLNCIFNSGILFLMGEKNTVKQRGHSFPISNSIFFPVTPYCLE